ncbi:MAG: hypothetical protein JXB23_11045 [Candidatus Aminicenantes bacterium]|nr:hypothetical protein [Candidatus Aminicenantes bacterium]
MIIVFQGKGCDRFFARDRQTVDSAFCTEDFFITAVLYKKLVNMDSRLIRNETVNRPAVVTPNDVRHIPIEVLAQTPRFSSLRWNDAQPVEFVKVIRLRIRTVSDEFPIG